LRYCPVKISTQIQ